MTTLYVQRIMSTLQGGVDAELGPKTLVVGPNATGKTALTRSIELALTGSASDIQGRDEVAKTIELLSLATPGANLESTAILSDGTHAKFELHRKVAKKSGAVTSSVVAPLRPPSIDPDKVLPLRMLRDNILGKPEGARRFFLSYSVREITRKDIISRLPTTLHGLYDEAMAGAKCEPNRAEIDKLLMAQEWAEKRAGEANRESNAASKVTTELGQGLPPPPTEADYNEAKAAVETAKAAVETAVVQYQSHSQRAELDQRLAVMRRHLELVQGKLTAARDQLARIEQEAAKLEPIPPQPTPLTPGQLACINAVLYHEQIRSDVCFVCRTSVPATEWPGRAALARSTLTEAEAAIQMQTERYNLIAAQHRRKEELLAGAQFEVNRLDAELKAGEQVWKETNDAISVVTNGSQPQVQLTIGDARATLAAAEDRLKKMNDANAAWESARKSRDAATSAETESGRWAQLAKACSEVVRELLDFGVNSFCQKVQLYLPAADRFGLRLRDGVREVCQFGLWKGENLFVALSGAEWARVTAALAAVCGPTSEDRLAVIKPEERAFDPDTLSEVLAAFSRVPQQVILESPVYPTTVPQGWRVVETGPRKVKAKTSGPMLLPDPLVR